MLTIRYISILLLAAFLTFGCTNTGEVNYAANVDNVIIIAIDTLRANHLGFMGYERPTSPFMDKFAGQSVIFKNAYCTKSLTLPSFVCLFSGLHTIRNGIFKNCWPISDDLHILIEDFQDAGFRTIGFAASGIMNSRYHVDRGFDLYKDPVNHPQEMSLTVDFVKEEIEKIDNEPMFLFVHIWEPHVPFDPDPEVLKLFADPDYNGIMDASVELLDAYTLHQVDLSPSDIQHAVDRYDGEIRWVDNQLSDLFGFFEEKGLIDNSIIIILSDHGESLGDDHIFNHRRDRECELHIPLMFHFPGDLRAGRSIPALVENTDILPTVMDVLGMPIPENLDGMSLLPLIKGEAVEHRDKLLSVGTNDTGTFLYSEFDGEKRWRVETGINPSTIDLDAEEIETLKSLGYIH